jgi:hypothetical protein
MQMLVGVHTELVEQMIIRKKPMWNRKASLHTEVACEPANQMAEGLAGHDISSYELRELLDL